MDGLLFATVSFYWPRLFNFFYRLLFSYSALYEPLAEYRLFISIAGFFETGMVETRVSSKISKHLPLYSVFYKYNPFSFLFPLPLYSFLLEPLRIFLAFTVPVFIFVFVYLLFEFKSACLLIFPHVPIFSACLHLLLLPYCLIALINQYLPRLFCVSISRNENKPECFKQMVDKAPLARDKWWMIHTHLG